MPLFYVALLPNVAGTAFTPLSVLELAAVILAVEVVVIGGHVLMAMRARRLLRSPAIVRRVNRTAGAVMAGTGATLIVTR